MILIISQDYPSKNNKYALAYVHTRNLYYKKQGLDIVVLNFNTKTSYQYEGIDVISIKEYRRQYSKRNIQLLISHAPNLKNHVKFIIDNYNRIQHIITIFHGHEVLKVSKYYPKPYNYIKQNFIENTARNGYDLIKLRAMRLLVKKLIKRKKITMIFVSEWMREHFILNLKFDKQEIIDSSLVIPNSSNPVFIQQQFDFRNSTKIGDFIIIRPLDSSKYGVDIVRELAIKFPELTFHIYGKGSFFKHYSQPENITLIEEYFSHSNIPNLLNKYRAALMPTRLDAQGVMMCEMASFGIPTVTSDIPICIEMLSDFNNVSFVNNETLDINLNEILEFEQNNFEKNYKFNDENTVSKEVELIKELVEGERV